MSDFIKTTNFAEKDTLAPSDPNKIVLGAEWDVEFDNKAVSSATKYDSGDLSDQATAETGTDNTVLMTPLRTAQSITANSSVSGTNVFGFEQVYVWPSDVIITSESASPTTLVPTFLLDATGNYEFRAVLYVTDATGSGALRLRPTFTDDPVRAWLIGTNDNSSPDSYVWASGNTDFASMSDNDANEAYLGSIFAGGGTLGFEAFTNSGVTTPHTIAAGSYVLIRKV